MKERHYSLQQLFGLVKVMVTSHQLSMVLRWQHEPDQGPFRSFEEMSNAREDLLQHGGGIALIGTILLEFDKQHRNEMRDIDLVEFYRLAFLHDSEEVLVSDRINKDLKYYRLEALARKRILAEFATEPYLKDVLKLFTSYHKKKSETQKFHKAIDEMQALVYLLFIGRPDLSTRDFSALEEHASYKYAKKYHLTEELLEVLVYLVRRQKLFKRRKVELSVMKHDAGKL